MWAGPLGQPSFCESPFSNELYPTELLKIDICHIYFHLISLVETLLLHILWKYLSLFLLENKDNFSVTISPVINLFLSVHSSKLLNTLLKKSKPRTHSMQLFFADKILNMNLFYIKHKPFCLQIVEVPIV